MSATLALQAIQTIGAALASASADEELEATEEEVEEEDELNWYTRVSLRVSVQTARSHTLLKVLTGTNAVSMFFALLSIAIFIIGWRRSKTPHMFNRPSVKLVIATALADIVFHTSYIYSLYTREYCQIANFGVIFGALLGIFYVSCLGINLCIIAFSKFGGSTLKKVFPYLLFGALALAFLLAACLVSFTTATFLEVDGCWFEDKDLWTVFACYYIWMFSMSLLNFALSIAIYIRLKKHAREMRELQARNASAKVVGSLASKDIKSVRPSLAFAEHRGSHMSTESKVPKPTEIAALAPATVRSHPSINLTIPGTVD
ncbi:hypothetical protein HDU96_011058, partial [Phlyctochytrium bullatum]